MVLKNWLVLLDYLHLKTKFVKNLRRYARNLIELSENENWNFRL